jgi:hypothetical protein
MFGGTYDLGDFRGLFWGAEEIQCGIAGGKRPC